MSQLLVSTIRAKARDTLHDQIPCDQRSALNVFTYQQVEAQGRWLIALWKADGHSDLTRKDWAELLLDGIKPLRSVAEEAEEMAEDELAVVDFLAFLNTI